MKTAYASLLFLSYIAVSCLGLYLIKAADGWRTFTFVAGVLLYGTGAALWMLILRHFPLSFAFPIAAGALIIGTVTTGALFLGESIALKQGIGAASIILGIYLISTTHQ